MDRRQVGDQILLSKYYSLIVYFALLLIFCLAFSIFAKRFIHTPNNRRHMQHIQLIENIYIYGKETYVCVIELFTRIKLNQV